MKYPDGNSIRVGDLIWWNEGSCVGYIERVMETREEYERWCLDEPGIALANLHPFHSNERKHRQHIGSITTGGTVVNSESQLEDEGVGVLSSHEQAELEWALAQAKRMIPPDLHNAPYCVSAIMNMDRGEEDWQFHFVDQECRILDTVVVPFRPDTRTTL